MFFTLLVFLTFSCTSNNVPETLPSDVDWPSYLGDKGTTHYSSLDQINKDNVSELQLAWTYQSGDVDSTGKTQIQCNPLVIDGVVYASTPKLSFIALNGETGEEIWRFNPFKDKEYDQFGMGVNRGVAYWSDGKEASILFAADSYLYCVDAKTGIPRKDFGNNGRIDLHEGLDRDVTGLYIVSNTPGIVHNDLIIMGGRVSESVGHVPGHIRAYNVKTGKQEWIFHTIPHPGEYGYETWPQDAYLKSGGANAWAGMSLDEERGIVYVPTGSASFDFYGGDRLGENLFANCLLALDAQTGKRIWHFQFVHHDLWDRDLPCPPVLCTVNIDGQDVDAVAQVTKSSYIFLFDRETGDPLYPIEEIEVPTSDLRGEETWPTQPVPKGQKPFSRNTLTVDDITDRTPEARDTMLKIFANLRKGLFEPPSLEGTLIFPGFDGGPEWGGQAVDEAGIMYVNSSEMPWIMQMVPFVNETNLTKGDYGKELYTAFCQSCHAANFEGASVYPVPSLKDLGSRMDIETFKSTITSGRGNMPSHSYLNPAQLDAVAAYMLDLGSKNEMLETDDETNWPYPYFFNGYNKFLDPEGYPGIKPPWGNLSAIDLSSGEKIWNIPFGEYPELALQGMRDTGSENYGGPVLTASGLLIIAATLDQKLRIFDKYNGNLLWEYQLPASGFSTPSTYSINGKQYIITAAGGGKLNQHSGDYYLAFSLPESNQ